MVQSDTSEQPTKLNPASQIAWKVANPGFFFARLNRRDDWAALVKYGKYRNVKEMDLLGLYSTDPEFKRRLDLLLEDLKLEVEVEPGKKVPIKVTVHVPDNGGPPSLNMPIYGLLMLNSNGLLMKDICSLVIYGTDS